MTKNTLRFVACLLFFSLVFPWRAVQGARQPSYSVTQNYIQFYFPDRLTFRLAANSTDTIQSVTLLTGTNGRSCQPSQTRHALEITPGTDINVKWDLDFRQAGFLPPGAEVWWQWVVTTSGGITDTTPRKTYVVNDQRFNWKKLEKGGITLQWQRGDQAFGETLMDLSLKSLQKLQKDMGVEPVSNIWITIYPSAAALQEAAHSFEWTGGTAYPDYNSSMIGIAPDELAWAAEALPHELSHLVVGVLVYNCHGIEMPTWLGEGLAVYAEDQPHQIYANLVLEALRKGYLPALSSLSAGFPAYSDSASLAYAQSIQVITFMIDEYGSQKMGQLLNGLHAGERIDEALNQVYGLDTDGLDAAWRASLGFASQSTPTFLPTQEGSRTPVPTLALATSPVKATPTATAAATATSAAIAAVTQGSPAPTAATPAPTGASPRPGKVAPLLFLAVCLSLVLILAVVGYLYVKKIRKPQAND
jgi:hypothetical protein